MNNGGIGIQQASDFMCKKAEFMYGKECTVIKTGNVKISEETR
jgi:hypothetical protein